MTTTETPMRERIARAICQSGKFDCGEGRCAVLCMDSLGGKPKECSHARRLHGALADAVLAAMREPSLTMLDEGNRAARKVTISGVSGMTVDAQIRSQCARECAAWRTMIDAAKEGK